MNTMPFVMNTMPQGGTTRHAKHAFEFFDGRNALLCSKGLGLEPCDKKSSHQRVWNHAPKVHTPLNPMAKRPKAKCPKKKRKFNQCTRRDKFLTSKEKYGNQNAILSDNVEYFSFCRQDYSHLSDSHGFIEGTKPKKQRNLKTHDKDHLVNSSKYTNNMDISLKEKPTVEFFKALEPLANEDFDNSNDTMKSLGSKNTDRECNEEQNNFLSSKNSHISRAAIPIGPRFQVEVPKWKETANLRHHNSDDDLNWLGIPLWPIQDDVENHKKGIGEGRTDSCSCEFPGSVDCVKKHVREARKLLILEIGTTFSSWKFDEMGEDVSNSWTLEEQKEFASLVKLNPLSNDTNFWNLAMEHFPSKSMNCMVNYYHNVYIPRRLSRETRSSLGAVDSDDDQDDIYLNKNHHSSTGLKR